MDIANMLQRLRDTFVVAKDPLLNDDGALSHCLANDVETTTRQVRHMLQKCILRNNSPFTTEGMFSRNGWVPAACRPSSIFSLMKVTIHSQIFSPFTLFQKSRIYPDDEL